MIFWRGWGTLAFLAIGVSVGLTALFASLTGTDMNGVTWQGLPAFFLVGTGVYYLGRKFVLQAGPLFLRLMVWVPGTSGSSATKRKVCPPAALCCRSLSPATRNKSVLFMLTPIV